MATTISITDGTTTQALNNLSTTFVTSYPMQGPEINQAAGASVGDGSLLTVPSWSDVTETVSLLIKGASAAAVRTTVQTIETILDRARQRRRAHGVDRCFIQVQIAGESDTWRSEILSGRLVLAEVDVWRNSIEAEMIITRRYYWEGPETALQMSSAATSETTSPVTWHNGGDTVSGERNYLNIGSSRVTGNLPTPLKLELALVGSNQIITDVWIANTVFCDPANLDPILPGSAAASGASRSWATDDWYLAYKWTLPAATITDFAGQMVRPMVAYSTRPNLATSQRGRLTVDYGSPTTVLSAWTNDIFSRSGDESVADYGPMAMPPGGAGLANSTWAVHITMRKTGGDSVVAHSLHLMPSGSGILRHLRSAVSNNLIVTGSSIVDNGIDGVVYEDSTDGARPIFRPFHEPVHVWPGRQNRLRVLVSANPWAASIEWTAQAWYRPRRLTL